MAVWREKDSSSCESCRWFSEGSWDSPTDPQRAQLPTNRVWPPCPLQTIQTIQRQVGWKFLQPKARCIQSDVVGQACRGVALSWLAENQMYSQGITQPQ